ncbi:hypothetical protein D9613_002860 [Agrocybe pediades]|uniref:Protein kinase domain-containing protein n=1 Tax=Agrocybe pediades TaxID=84607 RepID=A0A8H4VP86_9AGAR|nr:hypothetical protein D9613_002860 [Agrocybe pediades]
MLNGALQLSSGALTTAGALGVPFAGAAANILDASSRLFKTCDEIKTLKASCRMSKRNMQHNLWLQDRKGFACYGKRLSSMDMQYPPLNLPANLAAVNVTLNTSEVSDLAVAGWMYSDIWMGQWLGEEKVALNALRDVKASDPRATARFEKEVRIWSELQNDHIPPFYGIVTDLGWHIYMVSPWQENGNVLEYTKINGDSHCMRLIYGAAQGLEYLHFNGIIHGNVKCANILVSKEGEARLCDFGMSKVIEDVTERSVSATLSAGDSARWTAPELVLEGKGPSTEADTYSFAMAILELLTKKRPYPECRSTPTVIYRFVVENKPPSRPIEQWMTDVLWDLLCRCWQMDASSRPTMDELYE